MCSLKDLNIIPIIKWESKIYGNISMCKLCLTEKLWIINSINNDDNLINKKLELMHKCRDINMFILRNVQT